MTGIYISAAHKSSGKTTLSLGICAAFRERGLTVQPFKKGPDFIDPLWLSQAAGRACYNLDYQTQSPEEILILFRRLSARADISLIEGNKGLHDGMALDGSNSNAAVAKQVRVPVILVIDTRGMSRGIAPMTLGFQAFDPRVRIAGVILNQVGGPRHEGKLREVMAAYTDIPVLGAVHRHADLVIDERHLGLIPSNESRQSERRITGIRRRVADQVDLEALRTLATRTTTPGIAAIEPPSIPYTCLRVAIPRDPAFGFYYPDDLAAFEAAGAKLQFFDALSDRRLPEADALFVGGGFPETHMDALADNRDLLTAIRNAIENGLPAYAECGGLMYLSRSIRWRDRRREMAGVIPGNIHMQQRPVGRGYVTLEVQNHPWGLQPGARLHCHEFHHSSLTGLPDDADFAFEIVRGHGIDGKHDGYRIHNLLAGYAHQRHTAANPWVRHFLAFAARHKARHPQPAFPS